MSNSVNTKSQKKHKRQKPFWINQVQELLIKKIVEIGALLAQMSERELPLDSKKPYNFQTMKCAVHMKLAGKAKELAEEVSLDPENLFEFSEMKKSQRPHKDVLGVVDLSFSDPNNILGLEIHLLKNKHNGLLLHIEKIDGAFLPKGSLFIGGSSRSVFNYEEIIFVLDAFKQKLQEIVVSRIEIDDWILWKMIQKFFATPLSSIESQIQDKKGAKVYLSTGIFPEMRQIIEGYFIDPKSVLDISRLINHVEHGILAVVGVEIPRVRIPDLEVELHLRINEENKLFFHVYKSQSLQVTSIDGYQNIPINEYKKALQIFELISEIL